MKKFFLIIALVALTFSTQAQTLRYFSESERVMQEEAKSSNKYIVMDSILENGVFWMKPDFVLSSLNQLYVILHDHIDFIKIDGVIDTVAPNTRLFVILNVPMTIQLGVATIDKSVAEGVFWGPKYQVWVKEE